MRDSKRLGHVVYGAILFPKCCDAIRTHSTTSICLGVNMAVIYCNLPRVQSHSSGKNTWKGKLKASSRLCEHDELLKPKQIGKYFAKIFANLSDLLRAMPCTEYMYMY